MNSDACTNSCKRPVCGDMITTPYASWIDDTGTQVTYFESCDDGNVVDGDNCPAGCVSTGDLFDGRCSSSLRSADVYGMGEDALVGKTLCDF